MSELIDNREKRIQTLKEIVRGLHQGGDPGAIRDRLRALVRECDAGEIAAMEQQLIADGIPVQEIMGMCDLHSQVVSELLVDRVHGPVATGHPVDVLRRENAALLECAASLEAAMRDLAAPAAGPPEAPRESLDRARRLYGELMDVEKHYARKENLIFPILERYGITGPSRVMWGKDDEVREFLRALGDSLGQEEVGPGEWRIVQETVAVPALEALREMVRKEDQILLPMCLQTLNEAEWGEIWSQSPEIGWCLVSPEGEYRPPRSCGPEIPPEVRREAERSGVALNVIPHSARRDRLASGAIVFPTGSLDLAQLEALFSTLPVDLTFVDADDRVRFFSEGPNRIFLRPKAIIGRKVQHCHPPASLHVVERILGDFREGRHDVAEFWIERRGQFVHIRYFAVRDRERRYVGTLEVTQDVTAIRGLQGERRLLDYSSPGMAS